MSDAVSYPIETMRHSCAHVMAAAIQKLYPEAQFGVGPFTKNGFYYDIYLDEPLSEKDLKKIQKEMKNIAKGKLPFSREIVEAEGAIATMRDANQPFKVELLELLRDKGTTAIAKETGDATMVGDSPEITFYTVGRFQDLCRGPHVDHSGEIGAYKLTHVAGAYWRGNSDNVQLQRIYGVCFPTMEEVEAELHRLEEQKKRDHRLLGKQLGLFTFTDEVGSGLPLWMPKGTVIRDELERLAHEFEHRYGYRRVSTPALAKADLYYQSGHLPYYKEDLYPAMKLDDDKEYYVRPMNCPHHHHIFSAQPRSYRDLPLRIAEFGQVYRYEAHGALSGLMRTRSFCQNDAHIYCAMDEAKDEFLRVMQMHAEYYQLFGIEHFHMRLSLPDMDRLDKYVDNPDAWHKSVEIIRQAMIESGLEYKEVEGEAAFYGPKVDFIIANAIGVEYAISTNQLDFLATERFNLTYRGSDGEQHPVYCIHRAPLGSHERFTAFLIEHYAGAFPLWLAPEQVRLMPVADRHIDACNQIAAKLDAAVMAKLRQPLRVEVDASSERIPKKIRNAEIEKVPYQLVIGDKEAEGGDLAIRHYTHGDMGAMSVDALIERMIGELDQRKDAAG